MSVVLVQDWLALQLSCSAAWTVRARISGRAWASAVQPAQRLPVLYDMRAGAQPTVRAYRSRAPGSGRFDPAGGEAAMADPSARAAIPAPGARVDWTDSAPAHFPGRSSRPRDHRQPPTARARRARCADRLPADGAAAHGRRNDAHRARRRLPGATYRHSYTYPSINRTLAFPDDSPFDHGHIGAHRMQR